MQAIGFGIVRYQTISIPSHHKRKFPSVWTNVGLIWRKPPFPSPLYLFPYFTNFSMYTELAKAENHSSQLWHSVQTTTYHYREAEDCTTADPHHWRHFTLNLQPEKNFPSQCCTHIPEILILTCIHLQTAETLNIAIPIASLSKLPVTILISFWGHQRKLHHWQIQPWRFPYPPFTSCPFHLKPICDSLYSSLFYIPHNQSAQTPSQGLVHSKKLNVFTVTMCITILIHHSCWSCAP